MEGEVVEIILNDDIQPVMDSLYVPDTELPDSDLSEDDEKGG